MTARHIWLKQQLNITQWVLRRPAILKGDINIVLPSRVHLLLVTESLPSYYSIVYDVLRSMMLIPNQMYWVTPVQIMKLPDSACCNCWWLGVNILRDFKGLSFYTPPLVIFTKNESAKRDLWSKISRNILYYI